jgi:hypothetical protein
MAVFKTQMSEVGTFVVSEAPKARNVKVQHPSRAARLGTPPWASGPG